MKVIIKLLLKFLIKTGLFDDVVRMLMDYLDEGNPEETTIEETTVL